VSVEQLIKSGFSRVGIVHVRSALNPFLWSFSWSLIFLGFAAVFREDPLAKYMLLCLAAVPMFVTMVIGCFFAIKSPDRLQSEEYRLRQRALQILQKRGSATEVVEVVNEVPQLRIETRQPSDKGPLEREL